MKNTSEGARHQANRPPVPADTGSRPTIDAAHYVPWYLSVLNNGLASSGSRLYRKLFGIGLNEWRMLSALVNEPGAMANRVGELIVCNKSQVSRSLRVLEDKGLAQTRISEGNRLLYLTDAGEALHDKVIKIALAREAALMEGFSDAERTGLFALMERLRGNLDRVDAFDAELVNGHKG
ncbi:MAG: MarR family winged helix-turn-helix transcriptional regulator [Burkholderiaceae bacterium]